MVADSVKEVEKELNGEIEEFTGKDPDEEE